VEEGMLCRKLVFDCRHGDTHECAMKRKRDTYLGVV